MPSGYAALDFVMVPEAKKGSQRIWQMAEESEFRQRRFTLRSANHNPVCRDSGARPMLSSYGAQ
jgi:hypothetical protein